MGCKQRVSHVPQCETAVGGQLCGRFTCARSTMHTMFTTVLPVTPWFLGPGDALAAQHFLPTTALGCTKLQWLRTHVQSARASTHSGVHASYDGGVLLATAKIQALPGTQALRQRHRRCIPPCSVQAEVYPVDLPRLQPLAAGRAAPGHLDRGAQAGVAEHMPARSASPARSGLALARAQPGGAQVRRQRAPARPACHLRHGLQAYGALRVGLCRRRRRLRRGERQRQHPRPL